MHSSVGGPKPGTPARPPERGRSGTASTPAGKWILLFPLAYGLHVAEEYAFRFPEYLAVVSGRQMSNAQFLLLNAFLWAAMIGTVVAVLVRPSAAWLVVTLASVLGINAALHLGATLVLHRYSPGTFTAVLLFGPLAGYALRRVVPLVSGRTAALAAGLGAIVHAGVMLLAAHPPSESSPRILLFEGRGTSPNDVAAVRAVLASQHLEFRAVDSTGLNGMGDAQVRAYRLMIVPGGNYLEIGRGLTPATAARVHDAVKGGLNYLGICAGGLLAGDVPDNGLNLTDGVRFGFYSLVKEGVHKAAVEITVVGGPSVEQYWEDGPQYTGWGAPVALYPDGTPAIVEGKSGKGWVVLVGTHPEAPESWYRGTTFTRSSSAAARSWAGTLVHAALNGTTLLRR